MTGDFTKVKQQHKDKLDLSYKESDIVSLP